MSWWRRTKDADKLRSEVEADKAKIREVRGENRDLEEALRLQAEQHKADTALTWLRAAGKAGAIFSGAALSSVTRRVSGEYAQIVEPIVSAVGAVAAGAAGSEVGLLVAAGHGARVVAEAGDKVIEVGVASYKERAAKRKADAEAKAAEEAEAKAKAEAEARAKLDAERAETSADTLAREERNRAGFVAMERKLREEIRAEVMADLGVGEAA